MRPLTSQRPFSIRRRHMQTHWKWNWVCKSYRGDGPGRNRGRKPSPTLPLGLSSLFPLLTDSMTYGTQTFNAAFTSAIQKSLSWAESTQFLVLIPKSYRSILILSSHLCLGLPVGFPVKILKALLPSSILTTFYLYKMKYNLSSVCTGLYSV